MKDEGDVKPRNLFNPPDCTKAILGWYNYCCIHHIKENLPSFIHGMNTTDLEEVFDKCFSEVPDPRLVSWDGASFDAHQHAELIEAVDFQYD